MIFYHGTVEAYLPRIMKEGLEPCPEHAWLAKGIAASKGLDLDESESVYVYLTLDEMFAAEIAVGKAEFLALPTGAQSKIFKLEKSGGETIKTKPVLLKIDLPEEYAKTHFERDPHSYSELGLRFQGVILPKYITRTDDDKLKKFQSAIRELEKENK